MVQCYDTGYIVTAERSEGCNYVDVRSKAKPVESMERRLAAPRMAFFLKNAVQPSIYIQESPKGI